MRELESIRTFPNGNYKLVEDKIIPNKEKKKFMIKLNVYTLLFTVLGMVFIILVFPKPLDVNLVLSAILVFGFLPFIVIHELLHGLTFKLFNNMSWKELKYGIVIKSGVAYCISTVPVKIRAARLSLMMPIYAFCLPIMILGVVLNQFELVFFGFLYASGSTGDFYYMWKLRNTKKEYYMFEEMPTKTGYEIGYLLYEKVD